MTKSNSPKLTRAIFVVLVLIVLSSGVYFARQSGGNAEVYSNDFNVYYHAATEVRGGRDPYQNSLGAWTPYLYPPLLAGALIPLTMLPVTVAAYLWFLISAASMFGAAWMSATLATASERVDGSAEASPSLRDTVAVASVVLVLRFALDTFNLGQVNTIVAALAVAHVYLYARDRKTLSLMALALAISIKLTPALLIIYHIAKLRLKFAAACIAIVVGVTMLSFLPFEVRGLNAFQIFANRTLKNDQGYNLADPGNQSLRGAVARLNARDIVDEGQPRNPAEPITLAIAILLLTAAVLAARRARSEIVGAAPFFCCVVLLSPLSWKAHFVIFVLPGACLLFAVLHSKTSPAARRAFLSVILASFALFNLTSPRIIGPAAAEWADAHSLVTLGGLLILFAVLALNMNKFGKQPRVC